MPARVAATNSADAVRGDPDRNGGAGSYSIWSWMASAAAGPTGSATTASANSMPAITPAGHPVAVAHNAFCPR
jgi:hypothetical protein